MSSPQDRVFLGLLHLQQVTWCGCHGDGRGRDRVDDKGTGVREVRKDYVNLGHRRYLTFPFNGKLFDDFEEMPLKGSLWQLAEMGWVEVRC